MENMRITLYNIWTSKIYKSFDIVYIREREICVARFTKKRFHIACNIGMRNIYHFLQHIDTHIHRYIKKIFVGACEAKVFCFKTYQDWNVEMIFLDIY